MSLVHALCKDLLGFGEHIGYVVIQPSIVSSQLWDIPKLMAGHFSIQVHLNSYLVYVVLKHRLPFVHSPVELLVQLEVTWCYFCRFLLVGVGKFRQTFVERLIFVLSNSF